MPTVDPASRVPRHIELDEPEPRSASRPAPRAMPAPAPPIRDRRYVDAGIASFATNAASATSAASAGGPVERATPDPIRGPSNDDVLYLGLNAPSARSETAALRAAGARTVALATTTGDDLDGFPLWDASGRRAFVATLGLPPDVAANVERVLADATGGERAVLASIAKVWAAGERGGAVPSRVVLSGHSGGTLVWGANGQLSLDTFQALAKAMPRAAAQIEDVHLSACSTHGHAVKAEKWRAVFPNLRTMWAYNGTAPSPAGSHLAAWASRTTGRRDRLDVPGALRGSKVAVYSKAGGYADEGGPIERVRAGALASRSELASFLDGTRRLRNGGAEARSCYEALRALASHAGATPAERAQAKAEADALLRARYWEEGIRRNIARTYGETLGNAFTAVGLPPIDLSRATRREALAALSAFEAKLTELGDRTPATATAARALARGIASLDPAFIPERWAEH